MTQKGTAASDKVALVTGSAVRVGRCIARELARSGYSVWVHAHRSRAEAEALCVELGSAGLGPVLADLSGPSGRETLCERVLDEAGPAKGRLTLLVNSAASFERGGFLQRSDADLNRVLELNLVAPLSLCRRLGPRLRDCGGSIVNILDLAGLTPCKGYLDHGVAKAGLLLATRGLAVELAPLRVNGIAPGTVLWPEEPRFAPGSPVRQAIETRIPLGHAGEPEDVARAVLYLAENPFVSGHCLVVDGGQLASAGGVPV